MIVGFFLGVLGLLVNWDLLVIGGTLLLALFEKD